MSLDQSVMEMNGSPPAAFTPGWSDNQAIDDEQNIPVANLYITRGGLATAADNHVTISETVQRVLPLTLEITGSDLSDLTLIDIPFEVTGDPTTEIVFNSERQNTPWSFILRVNSETQQTSLGFTLNYAGLSIDDALAGIRFYEALAGGGEFRISGRHPVTGSQIFLARGRLPGGTYKPADQRFVKLLGDLAFIQNKAGVSFAVPEHSIRFQDANRIAATAEILRTGRAQYKAQPWVSISTAEQVKDAMASFESEKPLAMALHFEEEVVNIFGIYIPLGPVALYCNRSYITKADFAALRENLEIAAPGSYLRIKFTPFEGCPIEARYVKWLPKDEADAIRQQPMYQKSKPTGAQDILPLSTVNVDEAINLLKSWYQEDVDEQRESWERLKAALDEDRLSDRKLFQ
jgi:hypothetical protein